MSIVKRVAIDGERERKRVCVRNRLERGGEKEKVKLEELERK